MTTWPGAPLVQRRIYAPRPLLADALWNELTALGFAPEDTTADSTDPEHPHTVALRAREMVQDAREALERTLAERWVATETRPLLVDGGLRGSDIVAQSSQAVGVVKSHRTLYASGPALKTVFTLPPASRTSVFRVETGRRAPVLSWYLRLRDSKGHDPFFGLVRIESPVTEGITRAADELSRRVMREVVPIALPDGRWHNLLYPVRDCEEYLRAIG